MLRKVLTHTWPQLNLLWDYRNWVIFLHFLFGFFAVGIYLQFCSLLLKGSPRSDIFCGQIVVKLQYQALIPHSFSYLTTLTFSVVVDSKFLFFSFYITLVHWDFCAQRTWIYRIHRGPIERIFANTECFCNIVQIVRISFWWKIDNQFVSQPARTWLLSNACTFLNIQLRCHLFLEFSTFENSIVNNSSSPSKKLCSIYCRSSALFFCCWSLNRVCSCFCGKWFTRLCTPRPYPPGLSWGTPRSCSADSQALAKKKK